MTITLCLNRSPNDYAYKDITDVSPAITVTPYGALSVTNPIFILDYDNSYVSCNYAHITWDNGEQYLYYVTMGTNNGGQLIVNCRRDPLSSFIGSIRNCPATVIRYARKKDGKTGPTKVVDNRYPVIPNKLEILSTIAVNNGLINGYTDGAGYNYKNYALTVLNGGVAI